MQQVKLESPLDGTLCRLTKALSKIHTTQYKSSFLIKVTIVAMLFDVYLPSTGNHDCCLIT